MYFLFQDNFSPEQFKEIVKEIISETSCSVCMDTVQLPVHLCTNDHIVCGICYNYPHKNCPKCAQPFSSSTYNSVLLHKVLGLLPPKCRYAYNGCKELFTSRDEHEMWCGYQPTTCKVQQCEWTGCVDDIRHHIFEDHDAYLFTKSFSVKKLKHNLYEALFNNIQYALFTYEHIFWVVVSKVGKVLDVKFVYVPNGKIKIPLKITLSFRNSKKSLSSSIYVTPENVLDEEETSMSFVYLRVLSLLDEINTPRLGHNNVRHRILTVSITVKKD